jgi:hypothetical protein
MAVHSLMKDQVVQQRRVADRRRIDGLAGHGRADDGKDAGADDSTDAKRRQRPGSEGLFERMTRLFRLADQFVDRLTGQQLANQWRSPQTPLPGYGLVTVTK